MMTTYVLTDETFPAGHISVWPEFDDDDDGSWLVGVRHNPNFWTEICTCRNQKMAESIAQLIRPLNRTKP